MIVGVSAELGLAIDPPADDAAALRDLTITPHIDLRYTENLAFRIGAPIEMKRVAAKADPTDVGQQWTVAALIATVLKL